MHHSSAAKHAFTFALSSLIAISISHSLSVCTAYGASPTRRVNPQAELLYNKADPKDTTLATRARSLQYIEQARKIDPDDPRYQLLHAQLLFSFEEDEKAQILLDKSIAANPQDPSAWSLKANLHLRRHQYDQAMQAVDRALALSSTNVNYRLLKARIFATQHKYDQANKILEALMKEQPTVSMFRDLHCDIAKNQKNWPVVIKDKTALISASTNRKMLSYGYHVYGRGQAYVMLKQYPQAVADFKEASRVLQYDHGIAYALLDAYKAMGDKAGIESQTRYIKQLEADMQPP
jgi:tetratricopeptide (TPR) repeat protein